MCELKDYEDMKLLPEYSGLLKNELDVWHKHYLPIIQGATVLDVGAGCGETAKFFLMHGAGRVIAIENNQRAFTYLSENFRNDDRVIALLDDIGGIKIDIEGAEENAAIAMHNGLKPVEVWRAPNGMENLFKVLKV